MGDQTSGLFSFDFDLVFGSDFNSGASSFTITMIANTSNGTGIFGQPDNVDWTDATTLAGTPYPDGLIFVNEDNTLGEIWQMLPDGTSKVRIADTTVSGESTGIFDVSVMVGYLPGSILITNNQGTPASMSVLINPDATLLPDVPPVEPPFVPSVPALGDWGMLGLILLFAGAGSVAVLRNRERLA